MVDIRIKRLAKILVEHSARVKKGETVAINASTEAIPLALECYKLVMKKDAFPKVNFNAPGFNYNYYKYASFEQLNHYPKIAEFEAKNIDAEINIGGAVNTKEMTNINPQKVAIRRKIVRPISEIVMKRNRWVICQYPTNSLAQDAELSLEEMEDFCYKATNQDWEKKGKEQEKIRKIIDKGKTVRIEDDDTNITFSIDGMKAINSCGRHNMPDGEIFTAPLKFSTEGYIHFSFPAIYGGREVSGITLTFERGKVVKARAVKNEKYLKSMLNIDNGSKYVGEFGIGTNYGIKRFIKRILFDEKIGGTIHLALGSAYEECLGTAKPQQHNKSALHWDMIKDLRKGGAIYIDNKMVQMNGKFMI